MQHEIDELRDLNIVDGDRRLIELGDDQVPLRRFFQLYIRTKAAKC
jgi:hypothetical protein